MRTLWRSVPLWARQEQEQYWFDTKEAAEYLGRSQRWVRRQIAERTIPFNKIRNTVRFRRDDLDDVLKAGDVPAALPERPKQRHRTTERDVA